MKWSTLLLVASIGTRVDRRPARAGRVERVAEHDVVGLAGPAEAAVRPGDVDRPAPSISADGSGPSRRLPATVWWRIVAIVVTALQLAPPLVELNAPMAVSLAFAIGTMTVPSGRTTGWPPITPVLLVVGAPHVSPPSVDVLICSRLPGAVVVPLRVAVAVERTRRGVVADDPVLVEVAAGRRRDRGAPGEPAVGRAAGDDRVAVHAARLEQGQRGDQPDVVPGVVGDRGVGRAVVRAAAGVHLVMPGSRPLVQLAPLFVEVANPMAHAPPS